MSDERRARYHGTQDVAGDDAAYRPSGKRFGRRSRSRVSETGALDTVEPPEPAAEKQPAIARKSHNPITGLWRFLTEVVAELRKVIWPNRKQMVTYTSVVLVFVIFMVAYISGLDLAFIRGVSWLFG